MEDLSNTSNLRNRQRELERERRRFRDRQRRQAMSVEQREKHLARRRRNYQLRRQRAVSTQLDSQYDQTSVTTSGEKFSGNEQQAVTSGLQLSIPDNSFSQVGCDQGQEKLDIEYLNIAEGLEAAPKSTSFQRGLRLNHVRHLARSLKHPVGELTVHQMEELITKANETAGCRAQKRLRLSHLKHLARQCNTALVETHGQQNQESVREVKQGRPPRDIQLTSIEVGNPIQTYWGNE